MKNIIKVLAFSTALAAMASAAHAEKLVLKFGHVGKPGSLFEPRLTNLPSAPTKHSATRPKSRCSVRHSSARTRNCCRN